jgi:hypothetical protein
MRRLLTPDFVKRMFGHAHWIQSIRNPISPRPGLRACRQAATRLAGQYTEGQLLCRPAQDRLFKELHGARMSS